ncbi:MAG: hypothetical protein AAGA81_11440 [Acidobacteriota bacterium]
MVESYFPERASHIARLVGARGVVPLEVRIFRAIALVSALGGVFALLVNLLNGNPTRELFLAGCAVVAGLSLYFLGRSGRHQGKVSVVLLGSFAVLMAIVWFTNDGSRGSTPLWLTLLAACTITLLPARRRVLGFGCVMGLTFSLLVVERARPELLIPYLSEQHRFYDVAGVFLAAQFVLSAIVFFVLQEHDAERARANHLRTAAEEDRTRLEEALAEIDELRGLLPICCSCKRIRDEQGSWHEVESYISGRTAAEFTHSYCPTCAEAMMKAN